MKIRIVILNFLLIICCQSLIAQAGNCTQKDKSTRPDCAQAIAFFRTFRSALQQGNREQIASLISYPFSASIRHHRTEIRDKEQLLAHFDDVFNQAVRCEILNTTETEVWGNYRGFTIKSGAIWFDGIIPAGEHPDTEAPDYWTKYPFKLITVNNDGHYFCKTPPSSTKM